MTEPIALYVHWPWCLAKCPYCDFNSRPVEGTGPDQDAYRRAILRDLEHYAQQTKGRRLSSVFFGGGTPSLMDAATVGAILNAAAGHWSVDKDVEITLEANPTSVETAQFRAFHGAGVNRVSIGVQALNDAALQSLGREHTADEALGALDVARAVFDRYTFDIIYARPGQDMCDWEGELEQALSLAHGHISLYQLSIEPGTAFFRQGVQETDDDLAADLYQLTQDICEDAGLPAYEISNHAQPGFESRHNMAYWTGQDYIGIGPGAHGRISSDGATSATHQIADPARWLSAVETHGHGTAKTRRLGSIERIEELVLSGLRLSQGLSRERFTAQTGLMVEDAINTQALSQLVEADLLIRDALGLRATPQGRLVLGTLIEKLLTD